MFSSKVHWIFSQSFFYFPPDFAHIRMFLLLTTFCTIDLFTGRDDHGSNALQTRELREIFERSSRIFVGGSGLVSLVGDHGLRTQPYRMLDYEEGGCYIKRQF